MVVGAIDSKTFTFISTKNQNIVIKNISKIRLKILLFINFEYFFDCLIALSLASKWVQIALTQVFKKKKSK